MEKEREWFRLSGGKHFGYNRLGYFIGNEYIKTRNRSIKETMTFWVEESLQKDIQNWLRLCRKGAG
ncbi:hypothetical protein [Fictibacillus gelatini]|uniref:hypothetical protein n=1 Tax=Fictibacillus gelatini TaxID=225985 RepID=UPI0003F9F281|nr:hypothetical protein [Fictibacillus gelatini]